MREQRQQRRAEIEKEPLRKMLAGLRNQFEAILTPQQLSRYQEMAFRNIADEALRDPLVQKKIGASDQQKAALQQFFDEGLAKFQQSTREMGGKMLTILTPPQQEKLRAEIARLEQDSP